MGAETIVRRATEMGITLKVVGGRIRYGPRSMAPDELVEALRESKPEVIDYLNRRRPVEPDPRSDGSLLAWAAELAERCIELPRPVEFVEAPLRTVTTGRVSWYAAQYLRTITYARTNRRTGGWGTWTPKWWKERADEANTALRALREAMKTNKQEQAE